VTNGTAETSIKNHIYHCTTPCEMVICDSDGVTDEMYHTDKSCTDFFNELLAN
jgi:hypothetical protein